MEEKKKQLYAPSLRPNHDQPDFTHVVEQANSADVIFIRHATTV